jgi:hypothetical protein
MKWNEMKQNGTEWNKHPWRDSRNGPERNGREGEIEIEIKRKIFCISLHAQTERNRMEWNGMEWNETERNRMKQNEMD